MALLRSPKAKEQVLGLLFLVEKNLRVMQDIPTIASVFLIKPICLVMKKYPYLAYSALVFLFFSCISADDDIELIHLLGTWERGSLHEETGLDFVMVYTFHEDGTFEQKSIARQPNSAIEAGFNSIVSGTFVINGNKLTLYETNWLILPEGSEGWYVTSDELVDVEWNSERNVTLKLKERKSQLEMDFGPCAPNELCVGPLTFFRVSR